MIVTFSVDKKGYDRFADICRKNKINMSKQVDLFIKSQIERNPHVRAGHIKKLDLVSWFSSSRTELVEILNSLASSLRYERACGLKKNLVKSLILVFDDISPLNKLSNSNPFLSRIVTHNTTKIFVNVFYDRFFMGLMGTNFLAVDVWMWFLLVM